MLAAYIVTHGALTPGGGFQGGAILMAAITAIFVGGEYAVLLDDPHLGDSGSTSRTRSVPPGS